MKICVDMGHTPTSPGASGYMDELTEDRKLGKAIIAELKKRGNTVVNTTPADSVGYPNEINQRVATANASGASLLVSVHFNAGGGTGTEVLYYPGDSKGKSIASQISANVSGALGLTDRGPKARDNVGVVANTNMTAVLIETCFVDTKADEKAYRETDIDAIVDAICDGIEGKDYEGDDMQPYDVWAYKNEKVNGKTDAYGLLTNTYKQTVAMKTTVEALNETIKTLSASAGADPDEIAKAVSDAVAKKLESIDLSVTVD